MKISHACQRTTSFFNSKNAFFTLRAISGCALLMTTAQSAGEENTTLTDPAVNELNSSVTGTEVIEALMDANASGVVFSSGTSSPEGFDVFDAPIAGFPRQGPDSLIIGTGDTDSVALPNDSTSTTTELDGLNTNPPEENDWVRLQFDTNPPAGATSASFDWRFLTEEFPEIELSVSGRFNDTFMFEIGAAGLAIQHTVKELSDNNLLTGAEGEGTTFDGATAVRRTITPFTDSDLNDDTLTVVFLVFDVGDWRFDTAVLLDNFQWGWGTEPADTLDFEIPEPRVDNLTIAPSLVPLTTSGYPTSIEVQAHATVAASASIISAVKMTVEGGDPMSMDAEDGSFGSNDENTYYAGMLSDIGISEPGGICRRSART